MLFPKILYVFLPLLLLFFYWYQDLCTIFMLGEPYIGSEHARERKGGCSNVSKLGKGAKFG